MSETSAIEFIVVLLAAPLFELVHLGSQFNMLTLIGSALTAAAFYAYLRRGRPMSLRGLSQYLFPNWLVRHKSTVLDLKLFVMANMYVVLQVTFIFSSAPVMKDMVLGALESGFGAGAQAGTPSVTLTVITTLLNLLAIEFGYWVAHWMMHRIPWLWEFHKVHHSAEVMTPLTEWRQHPVELLLFPVLITAATGTVTAVMTWIYGPGAQVFALWGINAIILVFWYTILHLRHTHVKLTATGFLGHLIQSPAHHHIHHSVERRHHDKNLGYCLSVWDWAFGTLYMPTKDQEIEFGLGEPDPALQTFRGSMWAPCVRAAQSIAKSCKPAWARLSLPQRPRSQPGDVNHP